MAKSVIFAHACDADHIPDLLGPGKRAKMITDQPSRLFSYYPSDNRTAIRNPPHIHMLVLHDAARNPLIVSPASGDKCVYSLSANNMRDDVAVRYFRWLKNNGWRVATMAQLRADNTAIGNQIKASPDLINEGGSTALAHTVDGFQYIQAAESTTEAEIDAATELEP